MSNTFSQEFASGQWRDRPAVRHFAELIGASADRPEPPLEALAVQARRLTQQHFGDTMRLFAPLYLSNECVNNCKYCGFSRDNPILRVTLSLDQVAQEAKHLTQEGFRNILLVAGEHPKFVSESYLADCVARLLPSYPAVSLEVGPMEQAGYEPIVRAGAEGLVVYQETYNRALYADLHTAGPKRDFDWRLDCPERAYAAGFKRIGIGALFGLADWREEALALAAHTEHLLRSCWRSFITVSFPRLRPAAGEFEPLTHVSDRDLARLICAFRIAFPQIGIVLSTREPASLRDGLARLGITHMSAGSHTEPGGYTGAGAEEIHRTVRGRVQPASEVEACDKQATRQFDIADLRSAAEMAQRLRELGFDPVWKDWDQALGVAA